MKRGLKCEITHVGMLRNGRQSWHVLSNDVRLFIFYPMSIRIFHLTGQIKDSSGCFNNSILKVSFFITNRSLIKELKILV